jgi:hypothetical protein
MHYMQSTELFIRAEQIVVCIDISNALVTVVKYLTSTYRIFIGK